MRLQFRVSAPIPHLVIIEETLPMPDEEAIPAESANAPRPAAPETRGSESGPAPDRDPRADIPARLASEEHPADAEEAGLTDEEIALYRRRVAERFYNSREVVAEVARRMLRSRDI